MSRFGISASSGGRYPDKLLLSRSLQLTYSPSLMTTNVQKKKGNLINRKTLTSERDFVKRKTPEGFAH